ncbi:toxA protein [Penicillium verrucosum]|uniref:toxA protein n=1 Tax=Penicillium verrucosum TaxID=60171 RepID=UPI002544F045|nr:toxA protein [Penicillium verrucosum]KAJ5943792.1 toxA protein [Penicillium verrucosum]
MSQYDSIGTQYDMVKTTFFNRVEQFNFRKHVEPFLQKPHTTVIDFACGTGFYSHLLLSWGAASLIGIDISHAILAGAVARLSATSFASRACFLQDDGFQPQCYPVAGSKGFDVATGV